MSSPTQRSKALMASEGYLVGVVEHWNPFARIRQDLYGCIDLLGVGAGGTLAIQTTSASNVAARVRKIRESPALPAMLAAGWRVEVHGWGKHVPPGRKRAEWRVRRVAITGGAV